MKVTLIYVVIGWTGEYSDRNEWIVQAYTDEEAAKAHVLRAEEKAREIFQAEEADPAYDPGCARPDNPYDPDMQMDYTGTFYRYDTSQLIQKEPSDAT